MQSRNTNLIFKTLLLPIFKKLSLVSAKNTELTNTALLGQ